MDNHCPMLKSRLPQPAYRLIAGTLEKGGYGSVVRILSREWCTHLIGSCPNDCYGIIVGCIARSYSKRNFFGGLTIDLRRVRNALLEKTTVARRAGRPARFDDYEDVAIRGTQGS